MLMMVMEKPIQLTMVSNVPFDSSGAFWATKVENRGESPTTTIPQKNKKPKNTGNEFCIRKNGDSRQQQQDAVNNRVATRFAPKYWERIPLATQAIPPEAITKNERKETLMSTNPALFLYIVTDYRYKSPKGIQLPHVPEIAKSSRSKMYFFKPAQKSS